jgi:predicted Fe-Mo cluster-binding NifX family protein
VRICIPVTEDIGLQSPVNMHFGSAPFFMVVDIDTGLWRTIPNRQSQHEHGMCQPLASLAGESVNVIVTGGIGMGALSKLQAAKIQVFLSKLPTVEETITAFKQGSLEEAVLDSSCSGHSHNCHH